MLALVDMDLVCYRSAASTEEESLALAKYRLDELLQGILTKVDTEDFRAFLTGPNNFRKTINPEYKAHRQAPRPKHLEALQQYSIAAYEAEWAPDTLEADDAMSIYQDKIDMTTIICSLDKDMLQVPGKHFQWAISGSNWKKPDTYITQTELEGHRLFYEQCLKGDRADNVKGIPGLGEVKARKHLELCETEQDMFNVVRGLYQDDVAFLNNAQCLYLLRSLDDTYLHTFDRLSGGTTTDGNWDDSMWEVD